MSETYLILATGEGMAVCRKRQDGWQIEHQGLQTPTLTSVIAREGVILAGSQEGVFRTDDLGQTWEKASQGLSTPHVRWLAYHPDHSDFELAGTEPAGIFVSRDGGGSWRECREVAQLRDQFGWYLPYSPEAGCVRGFAHHGERAYAAVEVGGVLVSGDGGESWTLAQGSTGRPQQAPAPAIHPDVHSIYTHPESPERVYAPTGGGFYTSEDGGRTWALRYRCYCRAAWIDPGNPAHILLGPADNVDTGGRIEASFDGGQTWEAASHGLEAPWRRNMVERFFPAGGELLAILSDGELLSADPQQPSWKRILPEVEYTASVAVMEI